jgi:hypothetical protein
MNSSYQIADKVRPAGTATRQEYDRLAKPGLSSASYCWCFLFRVGWVNRGLPYYVEYSGNALWAIPFTVNPGVSHPLRVNGTGRFARPHDPRIALKTLRVRSTPASSGGAGRTRHPCLDLPSDGRPGSQSWMRACVPARFPDAPEPPCGQPVLIQQLRYCWVSGYHGFWHEQLISDC